MAGAYLTKWPLIACGGVALPRESRPTPKQVGTYPKIAAGRQRTTQYGDGGKLQNPPDGDGQSGDNQAVDGRRVAASHARAAGSEEEEGAEGGGVGEAQAGVEGRGRAGDG